MAQKTTKPRAQSVTPKADTDLGPFSEQITALAYALWQERGCPDGNPDEDWFKAEQEIRTKHESQSEIVDALSRVRRNRRMTQAAEA